MSQKSAVSAGTFLRDLYRGLIPFKEAITEFGLETELRTLSLTKMYRSVPVLRIFSAEY